MIWRMGLLAWCVVAMGAVGCGTNSQPKPESPAASKATDHDHDHEDHDHPPPPHGGTLVEWGGGKYHLEFTVDHGKKETVVYVLDEAVKSPVPIKADKLLLVLDAPATELELLAQPMEGEPEGTSSRFVGQHDNLGKEQQFSGTITGEMAGVPYSGDFKETAESHEH